MYLTNIFALQILGAVNRIEDWIESAVVDNEDSPLLTAAALVLSLVLGLWRRYVLPRFRMEAERDAQAASSVRLHRKKDEGRDGEAIECRFDIQGHLLDTPARAERLTGLDRELVIGSLFSRFLPETDISVVVDGFLQVLRGEDVRNLRIRLRRADGALLPAEMDLFPVIRSGEISAVRGMLRPLWT